jgi:hypothetical protein
VWKRQSSHTEWPGTDDDAPAVLALRRLFRRRSTSERGGGAGVRAGNVSREQALAFILVPLLGILVLAGMGLWSAAFFTDSPSENRLSAVSDAVVRSPVPPHDAGTFDANASGSTQPTVPQATDSGNQPLASAGTSGGEFGAETPPVGLDPRTRGTITIETFGYSFGGPPKEARFVADVRNIEAGRFVQTETGLMPYVRDRVMASSAAREWLSVLRTRWMPALNDGDTVAIGCSAGHHRSVTLGVIFADDLRARGYTVYLVHRDILRPY